MARRNLDAAPEPGKKYKTEQERIRGYLKSVTPKRRGTSRVTYKPTNE